ncbi:DUF3649 domain-containing protein [Variovorax ginsengisoli]|uniref:Membrane protein n=1 Tax=Variovorax ginsengisoli TaxID=363844 RepID=A0ABT9S8S5_9BURK|nr:DUF3649 domain-containing protein [Variovorax ginsengisoli]MDP9899777.1 putative membrane protein [Variovorax ginsengisoli]
MSMILIFEFLLWLLHHDFPNDLARRPARAVTAGVGYRLGVASRVVAAIAGGYGVAALSAAVLALCLPAAFGMARSEAALTGTLLSFLIFALAVIWVFAARTAARAWVGLAMAAVPLGLLLAVLMRLAGDAA